MSPFLSTINISPPPILEWTQDLKIHPLPGILHLDKWRTYPPSHLAPSPPRATCSLLHIPHLFTSTLLFKQASKLFDT